MATTNLTEEEKSQIIESLNNDTEPPPELLHKLFPRCAEKYDVAKLDRAKIATLEYAGKRSEAAILNEAVLSETGSPLQVERYFVGGVLTGHTQLSLFNKAKKNKENSDWQNLIVQGDNLQFLKTCYRNTDPLIKDKVKGKVKLVYIDPPFATKSDFKGLKNERSYTDKVNSAEFIEGLRERLIFLMGLMAENGSIYVHCDWRMNSHIRLILDEIFQKQNYVNEIVWHYKTFQGQTHSYFAKKHDTLLLYSKTNKFIYNEQFDTDYEDTIDSKRWSSYINEKHHIVGANMPTQDSRFIRYLNKWIKKHGRNPKGDDVVFVVRGQPVDSVWEMKGLDPKSNEKIGYPTQKPELLIERIINASSNPGDLIIDVFAGSGTTGAVAEKLGRRWIMCDFGKHAIYTMQKRVLRISESKAIGKDISKNEKYKKNPEPFCIVSCGAYDFSRIMSLRENKDVYINFVLGLFQIQRDYEKVTDKYKLANIYGEKDGNPVEIYPVWDDEYLKNVRVDEYYLKEIITQTGGKLKGDYYIITPETCSVISDTVLKNNAGKEVHFKLLKFPYKILEDVSRNFQIHEQPSSQENVNDLINSTGFYFNNDVDIEVKKIKNGLEITNFSTSILNKNGEKYSGLEGLAMLLVDVDYDGQIFDMEKTVFFKDINDKNEIKISGLTDSIAVVAIDKHGNESKPFILKSK